MGIKDCKKCRECCKFEKDEIYFAPLFTRGEIERLKNKASFKPYKNSDEIFQIELIKSGPIYVCPYLNNREHICKIYENRPFDCKIWPFIFMKDKKGNLVLACFHKDMCRVVGNMSDKEFEGYREETMGWLEKSKMVDYIRMHKELAWDYEADTFIIKEMGY